MRKSTINLIKFPLHFFNYYYKLFYSPASTQHPFPRKMFRFRANAIFDTLYFYCLSMPMSLRHMTSVGLPIQEPKLKCCKRSVRENSECSYLVVGLCVLFAMSSAKESLSNTKSRQLPAETKLESRVAYLSHPRTIERRLCQAVNKKGGEFERFLSSL